MRLLALACAALTACTAPEPPTDTECRMWLRGHDEHGKPTRECALWAWGPTKWQAGKSTMHIMCGINAQCLP